MIRDPSDGSVREKPVDEKPVKTFTAAEKANDYETLLPSTTSGLPTASARDADRRQRSKEWLRDYRAGKINPKPEGT